MSRAWAWSGLGLSAVVVAILVIGDFGDESIADPTSSGNAGGGRQARAANVPAAVPEPAGSPAEQLDISHVIGDVTSPATPALKRSKRDLLGDMFYLAEASILGGLTPQELLGFSDEILSHLEGVDPRVEDGVAKYELLNAPGFGFMELHARSAPRVGQSEFALVGTLQTNPGYFTGLPEDGASTASVAVGFGVDGSDDLEYCTLISQLAVGHSEHLATMLQSLEREMPIGGSLVVRGDASAFRAVNTYYKGEDEDGQPVWESQIGDAVVVEGSLVDSRSASILGKLLRVRKR